MADIEAEIERLLPCNRPGLCGARASQEHIKECHAFKRPAVAEFCRKLVAELEQEIRLAADHFVAHDSELRERVAELEQDVKMANEAVQHLNAGKPLGEIVGVHTMLNQQKRINELNEMLKQDAVRFLELRKQLASERADRGVPWQSVINIVDGQYVKNHGLCDVKRDILRTLRAAQAESERKERK